MRLPHRLTTIAVAGCLALAAASCGGGDEPAPKPTTSTSKSAESNAAPSPSESGGPAERESNSPTSSAESDASKPVRDDFPGINARDENGATAAFEYFVTAYHYSLLTGDISAMKDASAPDCSSCNSMMKKVQAGKGRVTQAKWKLGDIHFDKRSDMRVDTMMHISSDSVSAKTGKRSTRKFDIGAAMEWERGKWVASDAAVELATK